MIDDQRIVQQHLARLQLVEYAEIAKDRDRRIRAAHAAGMSARSPVNGDIPRGG